MCCWIRFKSKKTGRGPLVGPDWKQDVQPVMTCYKLVTCEFKWFGFQSRVESFIQKTERRLFTIFHRWAFNVRGILRSDFGFHWIFFEKSWFSGSFIILRIQTLRNIFYSGRLSFSMENFSILWRKLNFLKEILFFEENSILFVENSIFQRKKFWIKKSHVFPFQHSLLIRKTPHLQSIILLDRPMVRANHGGYSCSGGQNQRRTGSTTKSRRSAWHESRKRIKSSSSFDSTTLPKQMLSGSRGTKCSTSHNFMIYLIIMPPFVPTEK